MSGTGKSDEEIAHHAGNEAATYYLQHQDQPLPMTVETACVESARLALREARQHSAAQCRDMTNAEYNEIARSTPRESKSPTSAVSSDTLTPRTTSNPKRPGRTRIAFHLSMPSIGSWNGKRSGAGKLYVIVRQMGSRKAEVTIEQSPYHYQWPDGWGVTIRAEEVDGGMSRKLKKQSAGFCGCHWMVDSIISFGKIYADHEKPVSAPHKHQDSP